MVHDDPKILNIISFTPSVMKPIILLKLIVAGACCIPIISSASSKDSPLSIAVSSEIDRQFEGWGKAAIKDHGKAYMLASISQGRLENKLVMPVDEAALLNLLRGELTKRGFHEVKTEKPEIILTVIYGRGYLTNPHFYGSVVTGNPPAPPILALAKGKYISKKHDHGFQEKLERANLEKLFIRITAWAHPADLTAKTPGKKVKPKELWHTTMTTDDPGNRDLNKFMKKMLAAGSHFFDREMDDAEEIIDTDLPEGVIEYGDMIILDEG